MFAKHIIVGRLGSDPEMRYTPDGTPVTNFSVAVNSSFRNGDGDRVERTRWYRVTAWRKQAETCNEYLQKGRMVLIEAEEIQASAYLNKAGEPQASLDVTARRVRFLDNGAGENSPGPDEEVPF